MNVSEHPTNKSARKVPPNTGQHTSGESKEKESVALIAAWVVVVKTRLKKGRLEKKKERVKWKKRLLLTKKRGGRGFFGER